MALTAKQQTFCEEYMIDLNATQAAIRAGYSEKTARQIAADNLSKINIRECIAGLRADRSSETKVDAAWVLLKAKECFEACVDDNDYSTAKGFLDIAGKHTDVKAFDNTIKADATLTIRSISYKDA